MACKMVPNPLQHTVPILVLLRNTLALLEHPFPNAFRRSSTTLTPILMEQLNSSSAQGGLSSLIKVLVLSKFLQYKTEKLWLLLDRDRKNTSKLNRIARDHPRQILLCQVEDLRLQNSHDRWLVSCSFSAAHPLNTSVVMYNNHKGKRRPMPHRHKHSTIKVNHNNPRFRRHHHRLSLPPPHPRHRLLLMLTLPRKVQPTGSHAPFHCGPVSFFLSAVHLSGLQMGINATASCHLFHL